MYHFSETKISYYRPNILSQPIATHGQTDKQWHWRGASYLLNTSTLFMHQFTFERGIFFYPVRYYII